MGARRTAYFDKTMRLSRLGAKTRSMCVVMLVAGCHKNSPAPADSALAPVPSAPAPLAEPGASAATSAAPLASASAEPADSGSPARPPVAVARKVALQKTEAPTPSKPPAPSAVAKTPSAPPPPKQSIVRGTSIGAEHFNLSIQTASPVQVGRTGSAAIALVARSPFHCNPKYPYKFKLDPPDAEVSYPSTLVRGMSVNETHASMSVPFVGRQPGHATISGTLYMSVCSAEQCMMDRRRLAVSVQIR